MYFHDSIVFCFGLLLALYVVDVVRSRRARRALAAAHGCEPLIRAHNKLPFGLDRKWQLATHRGNILDDLVATRFARLGRYTYTDNQPGQPPILTAEPAILRSVLASDFRDWDVDANRHQALGPWLGLGVLVSSHRDGRGSLWSRARALLRPRFADAATYDSALVEGRVREFIRALAQKQGAASLPSCGDMMPLIRRLNIDIITTVFCGGSIGSQLEGLALEPSPSPEAPPSKVPLEEAFDTINPIAGLRLQTGRLYFLFTSKPFRDACETFSGLARAWIDQAKRQQHENDARGAPPEKKEQLGFVEELVSGTDDQELLRDVLVQILFAGIDTSTSLLAFALLELARSRDAWPRLRAELAAHDLLAASPAALTAARLRDCVFLRNVIRETLRLYPPVPINSRQAVRDTILPVGGGAHGDRPVFVPRGTPLKYCVYVMHRRTDLYGPDALSWNPDRWEGRPAGGWDYLPFNGGPRVCIGQKFALNTSAYVLARLAQQFDTCQTKLSEGSPIETKLGAVLSPVDGVPVHLGNSGT